MSVDVYKSSLCKYALFGHVHCENYSWPLAIFGSELQAITKPLPHVKKVIFQNCFGIWLVKFGICGKHKLQV